MPATRRRACSVRAYYTHVVGLVSFVDRLNQEINYWLAIVAGSLSVRACYTHVAGLVSFIRWRARRRGQSLSAFVAGSLLVRACNASQGLFCSCLLHACSRACFVRWPAQSRDQLLACHCSRLTIEWRARRRGQYWTRLWSRLTIGSCLLHACSRAYFVRAFAAGSLRVPFKQANFWSIGSDRSRVGSCLQRVAGLVLFILSKFLSSTSGSRNFWFLFRWRAQ